MVTFSAVKRNCFDDDDDTPAHGTPDVMGLESLDITRGRDPDPVTRKCGVGPQYHSTSVHIEGRWETLNWGINARATKLGVQPHCLT